MTPSKQQQAVIDEIVSGTGNIMVEALAGTGKTSLLMMLLPYISGDVFLGAFNVSIKEELEKRVNKMQLNCNPDIKTIHGAGMGAYKYGGGSRTTKVDKDKVYYILDELASNDDVYSTYRNFLAKLVGYGKRAGIGPLLPNEDASWEELISYYSVDDEIPEGAGYLGNGEDEDQELISNLIGYTKVVYQTSLDRCKQEIDFDDMLLAPIAFRCNFKKYDYVFCDEVQDNSAIRQEILCRMVKPKIGRMVSVGDKNQCIYQFTGALADGVKSLTDRMQMKTFPLSVTYRCPHVVVAMANQCVPDLEAHESAPEGYHRAVWLEPPTCMACAGTGVVCAKGAPSNMAEAADFCPTCNGKGKTGANFWDEAATLNYDDVILCRNNRPVVDLAYQLLRKGIPCQIEGRDFASSLVKLCQRWKVKELSALETKLQGFRDKEAAKWRRKKNEERAAGIEDKIDTLLSLLSAVRSSGKTHVSDLVDRINTMFGDVGAGKPKVLTLSSIHKWKGRESRRVYMLGRDKYMPSKWARQPHEMEVEKKNLPYVMLTRSYDGLIDIIVPEGNRRREV